MVGLLAVMLTMTLVVTHRVLTRSAEAAARERLTGAVNELALTAQSSAATLQQRLRPIADDPAVHALLTSGTTPNDAALEAAKRAVQPLQGNSRIPVVLWRADGVRVFADGATLVDEHVPVPDDSIRHTPMYAHDDHVYAWTVATIADSAGGGTLGFIAWQMRVGGPPRAQATVSGWTGEDVTMYMRNAAGDVWVRHPGMTAVAPERRTHRRGLQLHDRPDFGSAIATEAAVAGTPWVAVMETPLALVHARARAAVGSLAGASLVLLLVGTVLVWQFSRRLTRRLVSVTRAAETIAAGDYAPRVEDRSGDELGRLAASFNQMAAEVGAARGELMRRVREAHEARLDAERLHAVADQSRDQAERASRAKSDFLAVMSHELRTPLNAIGGYAQLLELGVHGPVNEAQVEALRRIARNQAHLLTLINDVLNYAKLDAGKVEYAVRDVPVSEVFRELDPLIGPQVRNHDLCFVQGKADPTLTVRADPDKLHQILLNLLANAMKFTPSGGLITLDSNGVDGVVQIHVRDSGIGIAPHRLEAIFDPFVQGDRALNRPADGVGLGLAISRDLARGMSGELVVQSAIGQGSIFTVVLPRGAPSIRAS